MYPTASPWPISTSSPLSWSSSGSCESSITGWTSDNSDGSRSGSGTNLGWSWARSSHGQDWEPNYDNVNKQREEEDDVRFGVRLSFGQAQGGLEVEQDWDKPDLLDSLIMEDQEQKRRKAQSQPRIANHTLPSLENLLKLLELQAASDPPPGRPITGSQHVSQPSSQFKDILHAKALISRQVPLVFPGQFPPINFKVPPPHHPPAVPASFHLPSPLHSVSPRPSPGSPADILLRVEEAQWQLKALEIDRKKTEAALAKQNPGKTICSSNSVLVPRLPPGHTSLDKLVVDSMREQARVVTLLDRMKAVRGVIFSPGLYSSLAMWKVSVVAVLDMRRRERMGSVDRTGGEEMVEALAKLSGETRKSRSVLWAVMFLVGGTQYNILLNGGTG
eukprot:GFUD01045052.1.p1 GENE.GFUD01045052.1~~GFUD01045052.1.p1  ORF type:complete len:389 (-),score=117.55 GFUD01045052.1:372-1538(-)